MEKSFILSKVSVYINNIILALIRSMVMGKNKKSKKKKKIDHINISKLRESRDGGQIALRGYTYQYLYSCFLILSSNINQEFHLEGIEDIDAVKFKDNKQRTTHIQLKYSTRYQDASFMDDILKNYLEAYLIDKNRNFKLVYDFDVANGNLSKLFSSKLDKTSKLFWERKIDCIKQKCSSWDWSNYNFDEFISSLSFELVKKDSLALQIETILMDKYQINTNNVVLYANAIKMLCLDKMEKRETINLAEIDSCIESVKFDISKGSINPAHAWIQKIDFSQSEKYETCYYEGKKALASDIANDLPVIRSEIETQIINSINENTITIIKASSGQGKTTLALRALYLLKNNYNPYQLVCCNDDTELKHIVEYFRARTRVGECPLILLDNLDSHLSQWNMLAQLLQSTVTYNYKLIVTTRENDWYNYAGDISNVRSLNIVKPMLTQQEAENIYLRLKQHGKVHPSITEWKHSWNKISDKQLLIEYVYLLTHGEMLADRISAQMKNIATSNFGGVKTEILRKVCFADICGIKLRIDKLIKSISSPCDGDIGELLKSMSAEFLLQIDDSRKYIEGMHPIRSQHIVDRLHEYYPLDETIYQVSLLADKNDISMLFSHYPSLDFNKKDFYSQITQKWCDFADLSKLDLALRGTFSGSVLQYFVNNKDVFDDAYQHGGLFLFATDICPFASFFEIGERANTLARILEIAPDNKNIQHLVKLKNSVSVFNTIETDIFYLCNAIYERLKHVPFSNIIDLDSYASLTHWLLNMNESMNLTTNLSLENLWSRAENISLDAIASLMYSSFIGNKNVYLEFVGQNLARILLYLMHKTNSHLLYTSDDNKSIYVEYILKGSDIKNANNESVDRLKIICRMLPIYDTYYADKVSPKLEVLKAFTIPNDAHKEMPLRNLVIMFHQTFNSLWLNTIQSNYEFDTVADWLEFWFGVRKTACELLNASTSCIYKLLEGRKVGASGTIFDEKHAEYNRMMVAHLLYPREHRPFEEPAKIPENISKIKLGYFDSIQNFANQFVDFIKRDEKAINLTTINLKTAISKVTEVKNFFDNVPLDEKHLAAHNALCEEEYQILQTTFMCCQYYSEHLRCSNFNRYQIKMWYNQKRTDLLNSITAAISSIQNEYDVVIPNTLYEENIFVHYPVILRNFNITDEEIGKVFVSIAEIANIPIDYLILLYSDQNELIQPQALKIPKKLFENIDKLASEDENSLAYQLMMPYPIEVTQKMLDCFSGKHQIKEQKINEKMSLLADLAEELWLYSKIKEFLSQERDGEYYIKSKNDVEQIIQKMLEQAQSQVDSSLYSEINDLYKKVCCDYVFGDVEYNAYLSRIILLAQAE